MPFVHIDIHKGYEKDFVFQIKETVMDCVQQSLQLPEDDRKVLIMEHEKDHFTMNEPYEIFIEIKMFSGRTYETKKKMYELIVNELYRKTGISRDSVLIVANEQPKENWAGRGGVPASEMVLGFKVEI